MWFAGGNILVARWRPPVYTEPGFPEKHYRTAPLNGLWTHTKGGFYHDARFPTKRDVD